MQILPSNSLVGADIKPIFTITVGNLAADANVLYRIYSGATYSNCKVSVFFLSLSLSLCVCVCFVIARCGWVNLASQTWRVNVAPSLTGVRARTSLLSSRWLRAHVSLFSRAYGERKPMKNTHTHTCSYSRTRRHTLTSHSFPTDGQAAPQERRQHHHRPGMLYQLLQRRVLHVRRHLPLHTHTYTHTHTHTHTHPPTRTLTHTSPPPQFPTDGLAAPQKRRQHHHRARVLCQLPQRRVLHV